MSKFSSMEAVDFRYILLEDYKKLKISDNELIVILMIDHLSKQGNELVTNDFISMKTNLKTAEVDKITATLVKKEMISFDIVGEKMVTSLEPLKKKLYKQFELELAKDRANLVSAERSAILSRLITYFEKRMNRTLSPLESDMISSWLDECYGEDSIKEALEKSLYNKKKSFKSIDKELRLGRKKEDIDKEGYSAVSEEWDKSIEETLRIAKTKWLDDEK